MAFNSASHLSTRIRFTEGVFPFTATSRPVCCPHSLLSCSYSLPFSGVKMQEHEAKHSTSSPTEIKNSWELCLRFSHMYLWHVKDSVALRCSCYDPSRCRRTLQLLSCKWIHVWHRLKKIRSINCRHCFCSSSLFVLFVQYSGKKFLLMTGIGNFLKIKLKNHWNRSTDTDERCT